jgi:acetyl esterase/lipase
MSDDLGPAGGELAALIPALSRDSIPPAAAPPCQPAAPSTPMSCTP